MWICILSTVIYLRLFKLYKKNRQVILPSHDPPGLTWPMASNGRACQSSWERMAQLCLAQLCLAKFGLMAWLRTDGVGLAWLSCVWMVQRDTIQASSSFPSSPFLPLPLPTSPCMLLVQKNGLEPTPFCDVFCFSCSSKSLEIVEAKVIGAALNGQLSLLSWFGWTFS